MRAQARFVLKGSGVDKSTIAMIDKDEDPSFCGVNCGRNVRTNVCRIEFEGGFHERYLSHNVVCDKDIRDEPCKHAEELATAGWRGS